MTIRVCASVSATNIPELLGRVQKAERLSADLVEVRLDQLRAYDGLNHIAQSATKPLIATNRPISERGGYTGSEKSRVKVLQQAIEEGFAYADIEANTKNLDGVISTITDRGGKIILSHHDYSHTPETSKLQSTFDDLRKHHVDVAKIVTTAHKPDDTLTLLRFLHSNMKSEPPLVSFAMGQNGIWSRVLAPFYGATFTYAACESGEETAPGQLSLSELRQIYDILNLE